MPGVSRAAVALLSTLFALSAQAAMPLPDASAVQAAMQRAIHAQAPPADEHRPHDPDRAFALGRLLSFEVIEVPGCVPLPAGQLNCFVSLDHGLGKTGHGAVRLERRKGRWEVVLPGQDPQAPPAPTAPQAQAAVRNAAKQQLERGGDDEQTRLVATGFQAYSLDNCRVDGPAIVACDVEVTWPTPSEMAQTGTDRMYFRLRDGQWHYGTEADE